MPEPTAQVTEATESRSSVRPHEGDRLPGAADAAPALVEQDLLVEDVSIDGMCGVY